MFAARNMTFAAARVAYRAAVLADSPTAYYRLGESSGTTGADVMGLYPVTYSGSPTLGVSGAVAGDTAITTASGKSALRNTAVLTGALPFTVEAWVKTSSSTSQNICVVGSSAFTKSAGISLNALGACGAYSNGNGGTYLSVNGGFVRDGSWHHVVGVVRSDKIEVFTDGSLSATLTATTASASDYNRLRIGAWIDGSSDPLIGSVDEVALYSSALSAARILEHYNAKNIA